MVWDDVWAAALMPKTNLADKQPSSEYIRSAIRDLQ